MNQKRIVFFGDSNTYGYEPSEVWPGRYSSRIRWTDRLALALGEDWEVIPEGLNGRRLPDLHDAYQQETVLRVMAECGQQGILAVMLGTNDLLVTGRPDAGVAAERMEAFLDFVTRRKHPDQLLIIAPPYIGLDHPQADRLLQAFFAESKKMNEAFRQSGIRYGTHFADAGTWNISLAFDFVHFSEEGHRRFAEQMEKVCRRIAYTSYT